MNEGEIRIGNWVKHESVWSYRQKEGEIKEFYFQWSASDWYALGECTLSLESISPITLTEDWLLNMGMPEDRSTIDLFNWELYFERRDGKLYLSTEQASPGRLIEYLHIAQNIHNSFTNKELTIKEVI